MVDSGIETCRIIIQESEALIEAMQGHEDNVIRGVVQRMRSILASAGVCKTMLEKCDELEKR